MYSTFLGITETYLPKPCTFSLEGKMHFKGRAVSQVTNERQDVFVLINPVIAEGPLAFCNECGWQETV